jgi:hypothetical protein
MFEHMVPSPEERIEELERKVASYQDRLGAAYVDRDRGIQDALKRAEDCIEHGEEIRLLRHQAYSYWSAMNAADEICKIYVGLNFHLEDALAKEPGLGAEPIPAGLRVKMALIILANVKKAVAAARRRHVPVTLANCQRVEKCEHPEPPELCACEQLSLLEVSGG